MPGRSHPVRRQLHLGNVCDRCRGDVGQGLAYRHARRCRSVDECKRRALADRHRLARTGIEGSRRDARIGDRHLPRADHLVAGDESGHAAITDRHQESLARDCRQAQHTLDRLRDIDAGERERQPWHHRAGVLAVHARWLAEQHRQRQVHRTTVIAPITQQQMWLLTRLADHGVGTAFTRTDCIEALDIARFDGKHVTLLRFIAPQLERRQPAVGTRNALERKAPAAATILHQFGQRIRQAAGPDVVNEADRIILTELPAAIDHLLAAVLHLRVVALHRGEIELRIARTRGHRGGRATAEADQHCRPAKHHQQRAATHLPLGNMPFADIAHATGNHDRLVVAAHHATMVLLEAAEIATDRRSPELVVECGAADRTLEHDPQRRGDAFRASMIGLPGLHEAGNAQVRDAEAHQPSLGSCADAHRAFVADLATRAGRCAGKRRDRRRVVVRLDLHQDMNRLMAIAELARVRIGKEATRVVATDHGGIVGIGTQHGGVGRMPMRVADHREQAVRLCFAVDAPGRIEDLVTAVLAVRLSEHHQLDIGRVATQRNEARTQILDLVVCQCKAKLDVRLLKRSASTSQDIDHAQRTCGFPCKQPLRVRQLGEHRLDHAIVQFVGNTLALALVPPERCPVHAIRNAALDASHAAESAVVCDVGRLARPR